MSERPEKIILEDILDAANTALSFIEKVEYEQFVSDRMRRDAVVRNIEIMGEAVNQLPDYFLNQHNEVEWHKAIGMRNRLIHGYFDVDYRIVWNAAKNILPLFKSQIENLLQQF